MSTSLVTVAAPTGETRAYPVPEGQELSREELARMIGVKIGDYILARASKNGDLDKLSPYDKVTGGDNLDLLPNNTVG